MIKLNNFKFAEFKCPCCGEVKMDEKFLKLLDLARTTANIPFTITSGYRCEKHNKEVGGTSDSAHTLGLACDIACKTSADRFTIISALIRCGVNRIGIADSFIHCDIDTTKPANVIWLYK